jgi:ferric-dicitrate binding protein FerR (iron transport regulator)
LNENYHKQFEDLLVKYLLQEASPAEIRQVEEWLSADPANQRYYEDIQKVWQQSLRLSHAQPQDREGEEEEAWQTLRKNLRQPARRTPVITLRWAAVAAAVLVGFLWWNNLFTTSWQKTETAENIITDTLPDGSIVTLNKHSSLLQHDRNTILKGEAFFRIAPDRSKPFHVKTGDITITVLGTSFNVRSQGDTTSITVETGLISVSRKDQKIEITAGEAVTITNIELKKQKAQTPLHEYYRPKDFDCSDTPLWQLVNALDEAYGVNITIANPSLKSRSINTKFHNETLDRILSILSETLGAKVERSATGITLK